MTNNITRIEKGTAAYNDCIAKLVVRTALWKADYRVKVWEPSHIAVAEVWPAEHLVYDYICNTEEGYSAYAIISDCGFGSYLLIVKSAGGAFDCQSASNSFQVSASKSFQFVRQI